MEGRRTKMVALQLSRASATSRQVVHHLMRRPDKCHPTFPVLLHAHRLPLRLSLLDFHVLASWTVFDKFILVLWLSDDQLSSVGLTLDTQCSLLSFERLDLVAYISVAALVSLRKDDGHGLSRCWWRCRLLYILHLRRRRGSFYILCLGRRRSFYVLCYWRSAVLDDDLLWWRWWWWLRSTYG